MTAAEVYFLRAEAALRGWNAGADEHTLYETGITTAFSQPLGVAQSKVGDASAYIEGTSLPVEFEVPHDPQFQLFVYGTGVCPLGRCCGV